MKSRRSGKVLCENPGPHRPSPVNQTGTLPGRLRPQPGGRAPVVPLRYTAGTQDGRLSPFIPDPDSCVPGRGGSGAD